MAAECGGGGDCHGDDFGSVADDLRSLTQHITTYIPFQVKFKMPKPDHGKRGYSDKLIDKIRSELYGA